MPDFTYAPSRPTGAAPVRPIPGNRPELPSYRYSQRQQAPRSCGECGGVLIGDVPTATYPRVDVSCLLCGRPAYELVSDGLRAPMTPEQFAALPYMKRGPNPTGGTLPARLVRILAHGQPMPTRELMDALNISLDTLRNTVMFARRAGHDVICVDGAYRLEGR